MEYHSPQSARNIRAVRDYFEQNLNRLLGNEEQRKAKALSLFRALEITFITTSSEDLAFTFFDTQNNRGVKLYPTDLLKAYHLRAVGNRHLTIQISCASRWEQIQKRRPVFGFNKDYASELFNMFLWRARRWRGQKSIVRETEETILDEFQQNTIGQTDPASLPLYPNANNAFAHTLVFRDGSGYHLLPNSLEVGHTDASLPFTLRQPIHKGYGFFLMAEKYAAITHLLFLDTENVPPEVQAFRRFFAGVWEGVNLYLKELFTLATVVYYDKFRDRQLFEFSLLLDHLLGALRLEKQYVFRETPLKFLREASDNLIDVIIGAYRPEEVFAFLKKQTPIKTYENDNTTPGKGVQGQYKHAVLRYYGRDKWSDKSNWITKEFLCTKLSTA
jgi:hypothetical protein